MFKHIQFPLSSVTQWNTERIQDHNRCSYLRIGQDFFNHFKCHKVTGPDRMILDCLYELDGEEAKNLIRELTDYTQ